MKDVREAIMKTLEQDEMTFFIECGSPESDKTFSREGISAFIESMSEWVFQKARKEILETWKKTGKAIRKMAFEIKYLEEK